MPWAMFWMWVACSIAGAIFAKKPAGAKDSGTWTKPTAEEGRCVPIVLGKVRLRSPNCLWWGDLLVRVIKAKVGGFMGIGAKKVTTGRKYYVGMMQGLCTRIDAVEDIIVGEKSLKAAGVAFPWEYSAAGSIKTIDLENLFGGKDAEGGLQGTLSIYFGSDTQEGDSYLASKWGVSAPGFRGMCYAVLRRFYIGTSKYLKTWEWVVGHCPCPGPMNAAHANINGYANPAHGIAYLMLTDQAHGGMGESANLFDWSSFASSAATLYNEGFGISLNIDDAKLADDHLAEILQTIDASLYTDPQTGLWTLKLIRADYDPANLPEFGPGDFRGVPEITRPTWPETLNRVVVRYISEAEGFTIRTVQDRDPANRIIQGVERCEVMDFFALPTEALALTVAARERHQKAYPVAGVVLDLKRKAWSLRPGSVFLLTWPPLGISKMPCRVTNIKYGALEAGRIHVEAVEDIFGISTTAYTVPGASGWVNPISDPVAVSYQKLVEVPYAMIGAERNVIAMGVRGDSTTESIDVWANEGNGYLDANTINNPTPSGTLTAPWSAQTAALDTTGFIISGTDLEELVAASTNADGRNRGVNLAIVDDEWISWTTCTDNGDGTYAIAGNLRGVMDTVPADHAAGARVWFITEGCALTQISSDGSSGAGSGTTGTDGIDGLDGVDGRSYIWHGTYDPDHPYKADDTCSLNGSSFVAIQDTLGHAPDPNGATAFWDILAKAGEDGTDGTSTFLRTTKTVTTDAIVVAGTANATIEIQKVANVVGISTDYPAWVRLYGSPAARSNDVDRLITDDPGTAIGIYADAATDEALSLQLSPVPVFVNNDAAPANVGYLSVKNLDAQTRSITVSMTYLPQEA